MEKILVKEGRAARMVGRKLGVMMRRLVKVVVVEAEAETGLEAAKRVSREETCLVREGVRNFELSRESRPGSVEKSDRVMCLILLPVSVLPTIPAMWRKAVSPTRKGIAMGIERKGELRSMFQSASGMGRALMV